MDLKNKNVLVVGLGKSGISAKKLLQKNKAKVFVFDDVLKRNSLSKSFANLDFAVISPGVPSNNLMIKALEKQQVKMISEIELASLFEKGKVIAVTGTNGKTTTVSLLFHILKNTQKTFLAGNVGTPYSDVVLKTKKTSLSVLEVSNFQLERIENFKPHISVILNLAEDHLDRYNNFEEYINAKKNIFKNQTEEDFCVINFNDKTIKSFESEIKAQKFFFSINDEMQTEKYNGTFLKENKIFFKCGEKIEELFSCDGIKLLGKNNLENILACTLVCKILNLNCKQVEKKVKNFSPLPNRLEFVSKKKNVTVINDSKATNIASAVADINAVSGNKVIIFGGSDKNENYDNLILNLNDEIKYIFIYGETKNKIINSCEKLNFNNYKICENFEKAVIFSYNFCLNFAGEIKLLLCPACASFDEFESYKKRGEKFKKIIKKIK